MALTKNKFTSLAEVKNYIAENSTSSILVGYWPVVDYSGMALSILIDFIGKERLCKLRLEWMSLGLDLYGDTLQEYYVYEFENIETLLYYLSDKYAIPVDAIPVNYHFDNDQFPNPITHRERKEEFEEAWQRFQTDFKAGKFFDQELKLDSSSAAI